MCLENMHKPVEKARVDADINVCSVTRILISDKMCFLAYVCNTEKP